MPTLNARIRMWTNWGVRQWGWSTLNATFQRCVSALWQHVEGEKNDLWCGRASCREMLIACAWIGLGIVVVFSMSIQSIQQCVCCFRTHIFAMKSTNIFYHTKLKKMYSTFWMWQWLNQVTSLNVVKNCLVFCKHYTVLSRVHFYKQI